MQPYSSELSLYFYDYLKIILMVSILWSENVQLFRHLRIAGPTYYLLTFSTHVIHDLHDCGSGDPLTSMNQRHGKNSVIRTSS